jgi:hypothetical protein
LGVVGGIPYAPRKRADMESAPTEATSPPTVGGHSICPRKIGRIWNPPLRKQHRLQPWGAFHMPPNISGGYGIRPYGSNIASNRRGAFHMPPNITGGYGIRPYGITRLPP